MLTKGKHFSHSAHGMKVGQPPYLAFLTNESFLYSVSLIECLQR
jgi:hypothetical protein